MLNFTKQLVVYIVLACVFSVGNSAPWKVISLLEICRPSGNNRLINSPVRHGLDRTALAIHYGIMHGLDENFVEHQDYEYEMYDICNQTRWLVKILLQLVVDVSYKDHTTTTGAAQYDSTRILGVFLYLSEDRTVLAGNILSAAEVPVVSFRNHSLTGRSVYNKNFMENAELRRETNDYLLSFLQKHQYDFLIVLSLNRSYGTHQRFKDFVQLAQKKVCLIYDTVTVDEAVNRTLAVREKRSHAFVIFGNVDDVAYYTYYLASNVPDDQFPLVYTIYEIERKGPLHRNATDSLLRLLEAKNKTNHADVKLGRYNHSHVLINFAVYFGEIKKLMDFFGEITPSDVLDTFRASQYVNRSGKSNCSNFICKPGFERRLVKDPSTLQGTRYLYQCFRCPINSIKNSNSDETCEPCVNKNISNAQRTHCFVPYVMRDFDFKNPGSVIGLTVNVIGLLASVFTIFLFEMYKRTPIVRASDRQLSQIQLACSLFLFISLLLRGLLRPNVTSCILLPSFIGATFSIFVAVTLAKVEKPLLVFRNRKQLTQKDINTTIGHQYFIIIMVALTSILLAIVQYKYKPSHIKITYDDIIVEKTVACSSDGHLHIQIIFIILLCLFTLIQAYRSRKLPDNYSESMVILYSSFTAAVFLSILFPLYHFQGNDISRTNVQWIILSSVALFLLSLLYAQKLYTMIFCPEKNTMKAWNRRRIQYSMEDSTYTVPLTITDSDAV